MPRGCHQRAGAARPPLLLVAFENVLLQQTDERWQVVDLSQARRFNRNRPELYIFRQLSTLVTAVLVPWDEDGPAAILLKGARRTLSTCAYGVSVR